MDCRQHGTRNLVKPELAAYQGPALVSANDAVFSDEDWEGIQRLQQSIKAEDPFKVGRFGIGFNSVYHLTGEHDFCCVINPQRMRKGYSTHLFVCTVRVSVTILDAMLITNRQQMVFLFISNPANRLLRSRNSCLNSIATPTKVQKFITKANWS